eukprot:1141695-Pelagomonas_calceolata.AAC.5
MVKEGYKEGGSEEQQESNGTSSSNNRHHAQAANARGSSKGVGGSMGLKGTNIMLNCSCPASLNGGPSHSNEVSMLSQKGFPGQPPYKLRPPWINLALQKAGSTGRVLGLEPFPEAAQAARENVESHLRWCFENGQGVEPFFTLIIERSCSEALTGMLKRKVII